jgi:hypothetical protein
MTSQSYIMERTSTLPNERIHITLMCVVHFHGHRNKMMPLMKLPVLVNLSSYAKFHNCTC